MLHCEDAAFRAFSVGTRANTVVIKGFFLLFFFFAFLLSLGSCGGQVHIK